MSKEEKKVVETKQETTTAADKAQQQFNNDELLNHIQALKQEVASLKKQRQTVEPVQGFNQEQYQQETNPYENMSREQLMDLASKELVQERQDFEERSRFFQDIRYSGKTNFATWNEIAVLRAYDQMDDEFKKKYGHTYENLRQGKYHQILKEEVEAVRRYRQTYEEITGQQIKNEPFGGYNDLELTYANIFLKY